MTRHTVIMKTFFCTISLVVHLDSTTLEDVQLMIASLVMNCPEQLTIMALKVKKKTKNMDLCFLVNEEFFIPSVLTSPHVLRYSEDTQKLWKEND